MINNINIIKNKYGLFFKIKINSHHTTAKDKSATYYPHTVMRVLWRVIYFIFVRKFWSLKFHINSNNKLTLQIHFSNSFLEIKIFAKQMQLLIYLWLFLEEQKLTIPTLVSILGGAEKSVPSVFQNWTLQNICLLFYYC